MASAARRPEEISTDKTRLRPSTAFHLANINAAAVCTPRTTRPSLSGEPLSWAKPVNGHTHPQIFDGFRFSALASQPPFILRSPIYAGVESTSISQGQRMPTSRPGKFTVIQTSGLARHLTFFPTENEPIFLYRFQGLKLDRRAHFAGILTTANSRYAIKKTGVNRGSDHAGHPGASAEIPVLRSPDPRKRTHFSPGGRHARVPGAARKNRAQSQFAMLAPGQPAYGCSREGLW